MKKKLLINGFFAYPRKMNAAVSIRKNNQRKYFNHKASKWTNIIFSRIWFHLQKHSFWILNFNLWWRKQRKNRVFLKKYLKIIKTKTYYSNNQTVQNRKSHLFGIKMKNQNSRCATTTIHTHTYKEQSKITF